MTLLFAFSLWRQRNDIVDVAWGLGFLFLSWFSFFLGNKDWPSTFFLLIPVSIWSLRLSWHIYYRNIGKPEDYRYLAWRKEWGKWFYIRSYLQIYMLQGVLLFLICTPILILNKQEVIFLSPMVIIGYILWFIGFLFEVIGDYQLKTFLANSANKGRLIQRGLWRYTRHPNYFGEVLLWWGIWIISFSLTHSWLTIISPLIITVLITKVSGIPLLERKLRTNPEFIEYKRRTSVFFPWFRRQ